MSCDSLLNCWSVTGPVGSIPTVSVDTLMEHRMSYYPFTKSDIDKLLKKTRIDLDPETKAKVISVIIQISELSHSAGIYKGQESTFHD